MERFDKVLSAGDVIKIVVEIVEEYLALYGNGRMNFTEFVIYENLLLKIQKGIEEAVDEKQQEGGEDHAS